MCVSRSSKARNIWAETRQGQHQSDDQALLHADCGCRQAGCGPPKRYQQTDDSSVAGPAGLVRGRGLNWARRSRQVNLSNGAGWSGRPADRGANSPHMAADGAHVERFGSLCGRSIGSRLHPRSFRGIITVVSCTTRIGPGRPSSADMPTFPIFYLYLHVPPRPGFPDRLTCSACA